MKASVWLRSQFGRWIAVNALWHLMVLFLLGGSLAWFQLGALLWTLGFAAAFWHPWVLRPAARHPKVLWAFWSVWLIWLFFAGAHRHYLGGYPDHGTVEFSLSEPFYAWVLAKDRLTWWMLPLGLVPLIAGRWLAQGEPGPDWPKGWRWAGLVVVVLSLVAFDKLGASSKWMGPDVSSLRMVSETRMRRVGAGGLRRALGRELPPQGPPPPFHVLLLVHESLNEHALDSELMPGLGRRLAQGECLAFPKAYAPASMTDVALPGLFSGVSPAQPSAQFHKVPLLWHMAKARGMPTALFSVQRMNYYGFQDFFLADGLDAWTSADAQNLPLVNDTGGDDGWLVERYRAWLKQQQGRVTFTVLHFNATHAPYFQKPGFTSWTAQDVARLRPGLHPSRRVDVARYWNAIRYLDHVQEQVLGVLAEAGLLEHTWVIGTSDHGECFEGVAKGRMEDLRPEALRVPLWMRLPSEFPEGWRKALMGNRERLVSNLDVAPTLAMALGSRPPSEGWHGDSLLEGLKEGRQMVAHNSGEIRGRRPEVATLLWEEHRSLLCWRWHSQDGSEVERVTSEGELPEPKTTERKERIRRALETYPLLQRAGAKAE